jgi:hypothetical protein
MLKGIDGIYGVGPQQGGYIGIDPVPQFQNPYGAPTITNPYSPEDRRQFGFQIPHQLQMNQQRQQYQPPEPGISYSGGSRDFYRGGFGNGPRSDVGTMGMQPQRQQYQPEYGPNESGIGDFMQQQRQQRQPQFQQQTNTDLLRRLGNPMPGTPEHNLRYPEIGTPEFEQLHGPGANAEAQRPRESGPITTMPISPYPNQGQAGFGQLMGGPMGGLLNRPHQGPGPGQFGYGGAPAMTQEQLRSNMQQQRPDPYQMYGGLGSLFSMQDAYSQRPAPITQAQSNEANRKIQEKYKATAQQTAQQRPVQSPVQRTLQRMNPEYDYMDAIRNAG